MFLLEKGVPDLDPTFQIGERLRALFKGEKSPLTKPFEQHTWAYAAIHRIATNISQTPIGLHVEETEAEAEATLGIQRATYWRRGEKRPASCNVRARPLALARYIQAPVKHRLNPGRWLKELTELEASPWLDLLSRPNPHLTGIELWYLTIVYLYVAKGAFWILLGKDGKGRAEGELPSEIWVKPATDFKPVIDEERSELLAWDWKVGKRKERFELHQVMPFRFPNPSNPLVGLSPLEPVQADLRQDVKASEYNEAFYDNDAELGTVLETDQELTNEQAVAMQQLFDDRHAGQRKRRRTAVLHSGLRANRLGLGQKDMDFLEQRRWNRGAVLAVTGTPEAELSVYENLVESNAVTQDRVFWTKTLLPVVRVLEAPVHAHLIPGPEIFLFNLQAVRALQAILNEQVEGAAKLFAMGYPPNEINERLELGLPTLAWGDQGFLPLTIVPAEDVAEGGSVPSLGPEMSLSVKQAKPKRKPRIGGPLWRQILTRVFGPSERRFQGKIRRFTKALRVEQLRVLEEAAADGRLRAVEATELRTKRQGQPFEVRQTLTSGAAEAIMFSLEEWQTRLVDTMRPEYDRLASLTFDQVESELGGVFNFDLTDPRALTFLSEKEVKIKRVVDTIRENVRNQLIEGLAQNESIGMLQDRIKRAFNFAASPARTLRVARTEVAQTQGGLRYMTYQEEGIKEQEWLSAGDEAVREDHVVLGATEPVTLGTNYMEFLGLPGMLRYPADIEGPANQVINCRCVAVATR